MIPEEAEAEKEEEAEEEAEAAVGGFDFNNRLDFFFLPPSSPE